MKIPNGVDLADAATVALGAIALQGVRRAQVTVGERVGVIGLGFLGQLTVQLLKASGCKVFGMDLDPARATQAKALGLDAAPDGAGGCSCHASVQRWLWLRCGPPHRGHDEPRATLPGDANGTTKGPGGNSWRCRAQRSAGGDIREGA